MPQSPHRTRTGRCDRQARAGKTRRLALCLVIFLPLILNGLRPLLQRQPSGARTAAASPFGLIILGWILAMVRLLARIRWLKNS